MTASIPIVVTPRADTCTATAMWDAESALLSVAFDCVLPPHDNPATALEHRLGIRPLPKRVVLGEMEVLYRDDVSLQSIEIRTTPSHWTRQTLDAIPTAASPVWLTFDVPYDDNGIFSTDVAISCRWDASSKSLALILGDLVPLTWHRLADTVACGVSQDGTLAEIRLSSVTLGVTGHG